MLCAPRSHSASRSTSALSSVRPHSASGTCGAGRPELVKFAAITVGWRAAVPVPVRLAPERARAPGADQPAVDLESDCERAHELDAPLTTNDLKSLVPNGTTLMAGILLVAVLLRQTRVHTEIAIAAVAVFLVTSPWVMPWYAFAALPLLSLRRPSLLAWAVALYSVHPRGRPVSVAVGEGDRVDRPFAAGDARPDPRVRCLCRRDRNASPRRRSRGRKHRAGRARCRVSAVSSRAPRPRARAVPTTSDRCRSTRSSRTSPGTPSARRPTTM